jgi:hypothetical protein
MTDTQKSTLSKRDNVIPFVPPDEVEDYVAIMRSAMEGWSPPSDERWMELRNPLLPSLRLAHMTLTRFDRAEIQQIVAKMRRSDVLDETMYQFAWAAGWFQKMADVCFAAEQRMHEHGAAKANMDHLLGGPKEPEEE